MSDAASPARYPAGAGPALGLPLTAPRKVAPATAGAVPPSSRRASVRTWAVLAVAGLVLAVLAPTGSSAVGSDASLSVSPGVYVGGQQLTFEGNLGVAGERRLRLQVNMNRPGEGWRDVDGFRAWTKSDGSFRFTHPAPSMFGIRMRVASGGSATPVHSFDARSQDLVLSFVSDRSGLEDNQVWFGVPFTVQVDTTPELRRRPDLPAPVFPGRVLTLQQRIDGGRWETLETTTTDQAGQGAFEVAADEQAEAVSRAYPVVYRVRQENWTVGGDDIGWFPSFPTSVEFLGLPRAKASSTTSEASPSAAPATVTPRTTVARTAGGSSASLTYGWRPALWDFAWEYGESLSSRPSRGTDRKGSWLDSSLGAGRASKHNGGLMLDSQRQYDGDGDVGTTMATLRGNPMKYGRWEARLRLKSNESGGRDYHARVELVPNAARDYHCGAQNITVADVPVNGSTVGVGAKALAGNRQWTYTEGVDVGTSAVAVAVEVSKRHISWFLGGRVIATVRSRAAVSDVPMTLRLSLVGDGEHEMNKTQFISDWQRGYSLDRGKRTFSGQGLKRSTHSGGC